MKPGFRQVTRIQTVVPIDFDNSLDQFIEVRVVLKPGFDRLADMLQSARDFGTENAFAIGAGRKLPLAVCVKELDDARIIRSELFVSIHKTVRIEMPVDAGITPVNRETAGDHWIEKFLSVITRIGRVLERNRKLVLTDESSFSLPPVSGIAVAGIYPGHVVHGYPRRIDAFVFGEFGTELLSKRDSIAIHEVAEPGFRAPDFIDIETTLDQRVRLNAMPLNPAVARIVYLFFVPHPERPLTNRQVGLDVFAVVTNSRGRAFGNVAPVRSEDNELSLVTFNELIFRKHDVKNIAHAAFKAEAVGEPDIYFLSLGHNLPAGSISATSFQVDLVSSEDGS